MQDLRGELRGRGRSESPHYRIGTPVILDLEDLKGGSLDRRRPVQPASHSPGTAANVVCITNVLHMLEHNCLGFIESFKIYVYNLKNVVVVRSTSRMARER